MIWCSNVRDVWKITQFCFRCLNVSIPKLYSLKMKQTSWNIKRITISLSYYTKLFFRIIRYIFEVWLLISVWLKPRREYEQNQKKSGNLELRKHLDIKKNDVFIKSESVEEWISAHTENLSYPTSLSLLLLIYTKYFLVSNIDTNTLAYMLTI